MTRDPTGYPEADDARGPLRPGPPQPRPPQSGSGPFPVLPNPPDRRTTGPLPATSRFPLGVAPPDGEAGSVPGFEFEGRRGRPGPENARPGPESGWHGPENARPGPESGWHGPEDGWPRAVPGGADRGPASPNRPAGPERPRETWLDEPGAEPKRFRYTSMVSQPRYAPPQAWLDTGQPAVPGFEFDARTPGAPSPGQAPSAPRSHGAGPRDQPWTAPPPSAPPPSGPPPAGPRAPSPLAPREGTGPAAPSGPRTAGAEWTALLRSFLPQPAERTWFKQFRAGLVFRGWVTKVAIPILAMIIFGVAVVVIAGANSGTAGPPPSETALGFPPATLAGADFAAAQSGRGVDQSLGQVTSDGAEVVAVGSQAGARIPRAQFFISLNDGRSWAMGMERTPDGGEPSPGHAARFVAGGRGAWVAVGPGSIWTSADGRTWTLTGSAGMPLRPGDQLSVLRRTASGFLAAGVNVPGGDQAKASPVLFLSANGVSWQRLDGTRLGLPAGTGRVLDIKYAATEGQLILISGDVTTTTTKVVGKAKRTTTTVTTVTSGAWLSRNGGSAWVTAVSPAAAPAGAPQITGVAAVNDGFVLVRPAIVSREPVLEVYRSADGTAWTRQATLSAPGGLATGLVDGGPAGAVVTAQEGVTARAGVTGQAAVTAQTARTLTAFVSATGVSWQQTQAFGRAAGESVSGVAMAGGTGDDAVITATVAGQESRQAAISVVAAGAPAVQVDVAKIRGAFDPQLAVNDIAAANGIQIAVGSANGYPAAWTSTDGGSSWARAVGATPTVFTRAGTQQLMSVTHGTGGWLAVGGVTAGASQHPVVLSSADGTSWQAADGEAAFGGSGLVTVQAAAGAGGYVIVGYQVTAKGTIATAWWSSGPAGATGWQGAEVGELAGSSGSTRMQAVTASSTGFVAVGAAGNQASAWTSPDGRTWRQDDLPVPIGSARAVLEHVASNGRTVVAVGTVLTTTGQRLPFAASSSDSGATWTESTLPAPSGQASVTASVTALVAAGGSFTATGTFGSTAAHRDVVVWTSANGSAWQAVTPTGQGLTGPGIQSITALTSSGSTMLGVGFTASLTGEQPVLWQTPVR